VPAVPAAYIRRNAMTWSARLTVQDVSDGPAPIDILAAANADDAGAVVSNTEGKIRSLELRVQLDEDSTNIKVGDVITATGHFQG
jgi:hypothetical protein